VTNAEATTGKTEAKHTPGPWHVVAAADPIERTICFTFGGFPESSSTGPIATTNTSSYSDELRHDVACANARLIAAAPDLLAVCKEIAEHGTEDWEARMRTLSAAIARAEGGAA